MNSWTQSFLKGADVMGADDSIDTRDLALKAAAPPAVDCDGVESAETENSKPAAPVLPDNDAKQVASLVDALDRIEASWITQLNAIKHNAEVLERKVKGCVVGLRQDMQRLDLLGQQAMKEATRSRKIAEHFVSSLDQIKGGR